MSVFFVHDVNHGIVRPLDRKFRVREINPVQSITESQPVHSKETSNHTEFQSIYTQESIQEQLPEHATSSDQYQKAIQSYQENASDTPKLNLGKVKDVMSQPVIHIYDDQNLEDAWSLMQAHAIDHLIILNHQHQYCGLLSEKVMTPYLMRYAKNSTEVRSPKELALSHFCDQSLLSTHPDTELYDLGIAIMEYGLDAVAVSEGEQIMGIITKSDILKVILKHQTFEVLA